MLFLQWRIDKAADEFASVARSQSGNITTTEEAERWLYSTGFDKVWVGPGEVQTAQQTRTFVSVLGQKGIHDQFAFFQRTRRIEAGAEFYADGKVEVSVLVWPAFTDDLSPAWLEKAFSAFGW